MGFDGDLAMIRWDLMVFNGDSMGFHGDLMVISWDLNDNYTSHDWNRVGIYWIYYCTRIWDLMA